MKRTTFFQKLAKSQKKRESLLCVGLDPSPERLPKHFRNRDASDVARFCRDIIKATAPMAGAYKPNWAFFEALGVPGLKALEKVLAAIPDDIPVIADAKRGDIGNTAGRYAYSIFNVFGVDAVTLNAYMGVETFEPFLDYKDKGVYALCLTSNPGSEDFQLPNRLYLRVARALAERDPKGRQIGLVVGATQSRRISSVRKAAPMNSFLLPGLGSQGGSARASVKGAWGAGTAPLLVNVSRSVLYASDGKDFAKAAAAAAEDFRQTLQDCRPDAK